MNIPEIPDLPPVNDVPPINVIPDIPEVGPVNRADLPSISGLNPILSKIAMRAQVSVLKRHSGRFGTGQLAYWPNELARIRIPVEDRMELAQVFDFPWLGDGSLVRVIGLWSQEKLPFRCWPVACPVDLYEYMLSHGHQRGLYIKAEWLERVGAADQDKVFFNTCSKLGLDYASERSQEPAQEAHDAPSAELRAMVKAVRSAAGLKAAAAAREAPLIEALGILRDQMKVIDDGDGGRWLDVELMKAGVAAMQADEWKAVAPDRWVNADNPEIVAYMDENMTTRHWAILGACNRIVQCKSGNELCKYGIRRGWEAMYPEAAKVLKETEV